MTANDQVWPTIPTYTYVGKNQFRGKSLPTYVYPPSLKAAVREAIGGELGDYPDRQGSAVSYCPLFIF